MFFTLTNKMLENVEEKEAQAAPLSRHNSQRRNVVVVEDDPPAPTRQCCGNS